MRKTDLKKKNTFVSASSRNRFSLSFLWLFVHCGNKREYQQWTTKSVVLPLKTWYTANVKPDKHASKHWILNITFRYTFETQILMTGFWSLDSVFLYKLSISLHSFSAHTHTHTRAPTHTHPQTKSTHKTPTQYESDIMPFRITPSFSTSGPTFIVPHSPISKI